MRRLLLPLGVGLFGAMLGTGLVLAGVHVYMDHATWHTLLNQIAAQQRPPPPVVE